MTREEAIAHGLEVHETKHSMKRRSPWHQYHRKGTYMLTLVVEGRLPLFGELRGNTEAPIGSPEAPRIECSALGNAILREEIGKISHYYPQVEVWKVCLMPDHLHMIVRVKEDLPEKNHLGMIVRGFKAGCSQAWWRSTGVDTPGTIPAAGAGATLAATATKAAAKATAPTGAATTGANAPGTIPAATGAATATSAKATAPTPASPAAKATAPAGPAAKAAGAGLAAVPEASASAKRRPLFEEGYNDKILLHDGQLNNWKAYLEDNPRRLLLKRQNPHLFTVLHDMELADHHCQIVGNRFLLDIPDKMAVIVHRRYSDEENARLRKEWLACGERGGVLVSAAISPKEKEVLREAMNRGYRIILLRENGFPKLYKPSGESFRACSEGRLLQISPWQYHMEKKTITRAQCLELNSMAERIAGPMPPKG